MAYLKTIFRISAVNVALQQISVPGEDHRQRIFVILTDGSTEDSTQTTTATAAKLKRSLYF